MNEFNEVFYNVHGREDLPSPGEKDHQDKNGLAQTASTVSLVVTPLLRSS